MKKIVQSFCKISIAAVIYICCPASVLSGIEFIEGEPPDWENQGYDYPIYTNVKFPHAKNPPYMQKHYNPTGSCKTAFSIPDAWEGNEIYLHFGAVSSAMYVWINEKQVGYSEDSKTLAEFNITPYLKEGENTMAVLVYKWSDASYLEDQDFWRLGGITRDVFLMARNYYYIRDYKQMGVGGDNRWGAPIHSEYRLTEQAYSYSFKMIPVGNFQTT